MHVKDMAILNIGLYNILQDLLTCMTESAVTFRRYFRTIRALHRKRMKHLTRL